MGPHTVTRSHTDVKNLAYGVCAAVALGAEGSFDYEHGGHLVLEDCKLIFECPHGTVTLFPSGSVRHKNIPIRENELRRSITLYSAAGLFRWYDLNDQTVGKAYPTSAEESQYKRGGLGRWRKACDTRLTVDELAVYLQGMVDASNVVAG